MYCPNCGSNNQAAHHYCRSCGLRLDEISRTVAGQFPSPEYAIMIRRKERFEKLGMGSLAITGAVGLAMIIYKVGAYKSELFGAATLMWAAFGAFALFGLLAIFFFNYPVFTNLDKANPRLDPHEPVKSPDTNKLLEDRVFEPASVIEHSTELLEIPLKK